MLFEIKIMIADEEQENEYGSKSLDSTVLDYSNIELLENGETYIAENEKFRVRKRGLDEKNEFQSFLPFVIISDLGTKDFLDSNALIEYLRDN